MGNGNRKEIKKKNGEDLQIREREKREGRGSQKEIRRSIKTQEKVKERRGGRREMENL